MCLLQVLHVSHTQYQVHRYLLLPIDVVNSAPGFGRESAREIYFDQNNQLPSDAHLPTIPPFHSKIAFIFTQERNSYILTKVDIYVIEKPPTFAIKDKPAQLSTLSYFVNKTREMVTMSS